MAGMMSVLIAICMMCVLTVAHPSNLTSFRDEVAGIGITNVKAITDDSRFVRGSDALRVLVILNMDVEDSKFEWVQSCNTVDPDDTLYTLSFFHVEGNIGSETHPRRRFMSVWICSSKIIVNETEYQISDEMIQAMDSLWEELASEPVQYIYPLS